MSLTAHEENITTNNKQMKQRCSTERQD